MKIGQVKWNSKQKNLAVNVISQRGESLTCTCLVRSFLVLNITVFQIGLVKKLLDCGYVCYDFSKTWFSAQHSEAYGISWCRAGKVWEICKPRWCEAFFIAEIQCYTVRNHCNPSSRPSLQHLNFVYVFFRVRAPVRRRGFSAHW